MKKIHLLASFLLLIFTNCDSDNKQDKSTESNGTGGQAVSLPNLGGYWVNDGWWQTLKTTKSPLKASGKVDQFSAAIFHQDTSRKWVADLSYGWHEGQQLTLREKDGGFQLYDPQNAAVQAIPLLPQADGSIHLDSTPMVRLGDGFMAFNVIASTVLGGQYDWGGKPVLLNPDGTVSGLDGYYRYELLLDYVVDELGTDQLLLSREGQSPDFYAFTLTGNQLKLFALDDIGGKDAFQYKVGKVKYELTKK